MSTYPVDVKSANHSSVATHAIFAGPARVVGIYMSKEKNVGASAVTIKNDTNWNVTNYKFNNKIKDVKNEKIKKSLLELTKVFKEKWKNFYLFYSYFWAHVPHLKIIKKLIKLQIMQ